MDNITEKLNGATKEELDILNSKVDTATEEMGKINSKKDMLKILRKDFTENLLTAVKEQFPNRKLVACMELHTYSSLSRNFLEQYKDCMNKADEAVVYFNRHAIELKRLEDLSTELVAEAFGKDGLRVFTDKSEVEEFVKKNAGEQVNILMMSSGNFGGVDLKQLAKEVIG